jgi:hypothetical protein
MALRACRWDVDLATTAEILCGCDRFEVPRVRAAAVAATMVELQPFGDWAAYLLVGPPMDEDGTASAGAGTGL